MFSSVLQSTRAIDSPDTATLRKAYPLPPVDLQGQTTPAPEENQYSVQFRDFLIAVLYVYKNKCAMIILFCAVFTL